VAPGPSSDGMIRAAIAAMSRAVAESKCSSAVDEGEAAASCACCWAEAIADHAATPTVPRIQSRRVNFVIVTRILHATSTPSQRRFADTPCCRRWNSPGFARLRLVLVALRQWGEDHLFTAGEPMQVMVDKAAGRPIGRLRLTARDGHTLDPSEVIVKMGRAGR
jgi:hypothetical protein